MYLSFHSGFFYISGGYLPTEYNLSLGDMIHIKSLGEELPETMTEILHSELYSTYLPRDLNKRYDMMKLFVL